MCWCTKYHLPFQNGEDAGIVFNNTDPCEYGCGKLYGSDKDDLHHHFSMVCVDCLEKFNLKTRCGICANFVVDGCHVVSGTVICERCIYWTMERGEVDVDVRAFFSRPASERLGQGADTVPMDNVLGGVGYPVDIPSFVESAKNYNARDRAYRTKVMKRNAGDRQRIVDAGVRNEHTAASIDCHRRWPVDADMSDFLDYYVHARQSAHSYNLGLEWLAKQMRDASDPAALYDKYMAHMNGTRTCGHQ